MLSLLSIVVSLAASPQTAPQSAPPAGNHRIRLIRATDQTPIGGAELFDVDGGDDAGRAIVRPRMPSDPEPGFVKRGRRLVADGDGFVELGPGRWHGLLARAPGWFQMRELYDFRDPRSDTLELLPDDPLTIELKDAHGAAVEKAFVEFQDFPWQCGSGPLYNATWHAASDRSGRISFPHYAWWMTDDFCMSGTFLTPQFPLETALRFTIAKIAYEPPFVLPIAAPTITWELPPLSKVRVEFVGAETLPADRPITFELVGPNGLFGTPDRYASDHGAAVEIPSEVGVRLRAQFHWSAPIADRWSAPDRFAYGNAHALEGGCALLRVALANDPLEIRVRPVRGDGSTAMGQFDAVVGWNDGRGFRWNSTVDAISADETGVLRFTWQRPRLAGDERPSALHVALRHHVQLYGWEPLEVREDASRDLAWPAGSELDAGTLIVSSSR
jgi:hypothetical protein